MAPIRTYHQLTDPDRSGLGDQIAAQRGRVAERLAQVGRIVAVMSGKGGVGKSYVTAHLARALARAGLATAVLDADLKAPTACAASPWRWCWRTARRSRSADPSPKASSGGERWKPRHCASFSGTSRGGGSTSC